MPRTQPPPDEPHEFEPPDGFRLVWVERDDRRMLPIPGGKCRRPGCLRPAVWELHRSNGWWRYCDWHTYGSRFLDGRLVSPRWIPADDRQLQREGAQSDE